MSRSDSSRTPGLTRRGVLGALGAAVALGSLSACGRDARPPAPGASTDLEGEIKGAGATSQSDAQDAWVNGFMDRNLNAAVDYAGGGSGAGRTKLMAGAVDFAGSDAPLDEAEAEELDGAVELPLYISPIAVAYHLPGLAGHGRLNMTGEVIARIFAGEITSWRDPAIAALNEGADLPEARITVVHRSDDSGTTKNITGYLHAVAPRVWPHKGAETWPLGGGQSGDGTSGMIQTLTAAVGTIGYADASKVPDTLGTVAVGSPGSFVAYSAQAAAAALDASQMSEHATDSRLVYALNHSAEGTYPIILVSYLIARQRYADPGIAPVLKAYLRYAASAEGQQAASRAAGCAPISEELRTRVNAAIETIVG
ncbi:phosphate ABC transporter substrate-binding protein PstS [Actinomyces bowdenii]|uniref:phosphate ABC transporter substrate-binding protein PstS n=1 Tax=Actinomyces bowdenii TaxID=131109 RepID=UPI001ABC1461|nr:phosphate ABC transporter substrate-binding protein PstS [Actinomyces bowdenii]